MIMGLGSNGGQLVTPDYQNPGENNYDYEGKFGEIPKENLIYKAAVEIIK